MSCSLLQLLLWDFCRFKIIYSYVVTTSCLIFFSTVPKEILFDDDEIFPTRLPSEGKSKRQCRSLATKYQALLDLETKCKSRNEVCRELSVGHSTLATWVKFSNDIKNAYLSNERAPYRKRLRKSNFADIEAAVLEWCYKIQSEEKQLTSASISLKANQIARYLGYSQESFRGSLGWVERFRLRHGISTKKKKMD